MKRSHLRVALVAGLFLAAGAVAAVAGMWTGLPTPSASSSGSGSASSAATLPLTGNETGAFDTNLSGGRNPQTIAPSISQLKTYMFGNGGTAGAVANTTAVATSGAATCVAADRCSISSEALTTAVSAFYTLRVTSTAILSTSIIHASVMNISNTSTGTTIRTVKPDLASGGAVVITVKNEGGIAFDGTIRVAITVVN